MKLFYASVIILIVSFILFPISARFGWMLVDVGSILAIQTLCLLVTGVFAMAVINICRGIKIGYSIAILSLAIILELMMIMSLDWSLGNYKSNVLINEVFSFIIGQ